MNIPAIPVLYGTESGNAEYCAEQLARALKTRGMDARAIDMDDFDPILIERVSAAAFVTSTYGNGDPPSNARKMLEYLQREDVQLPKLSFAVCGLGDETFHHFAKCGQDFEAALLRAGAAPLTDRVDCDIDFDDSFEDFERATVTALEEQQATAAATELREAESNATTPSESVAAPAQSSRVFAATLLEKQKLSGIGSNKWTMHYTFDISAAPEPYQVGDCFAIHPTNGPPVIDSVLSALREETSHPVSWRGQTLPLGEVLAQACLRHVDNALLQTLAKLPHGDERPGGTALADGDDAARRYREERDVLDVLVDNAPHGAAAQDVVQHLRRLAPRMYSVASSPAKNPAAVSLVVETVRYQRRGLVVQGVASNYLATRVEPGETLDMHLVPNTAFRFDDSDRPVIMVGPGTGIAPFRAYLEHLEQIHSPQNCRLTWLFFGHQRFSTDFLFQEDIMRWREAGILSRLDLAWSRMHPEKVYVQRKIREQGAAVWAWLQRGAQVYVCGDAHGMEPGVARALRDVAEEHGGVRDTHAWFERLIEEGHYHADVY